MEKKKRHIVYLLLWVSIIMPAVPVFPRHHHADGLICMKNDAEPHCRHDKGYIARHFVQRIPRTGRQVYVPESVPLPAVPGTFGRQPHASGEPCRRVSYSPYIEPLHGACIARVSGLRAPPGLLA